QEPSSCDGRPDLGGGFTLRCLQRLSGPYVATQRCSRRNNWHTRGMSLPVLSYWGEISARLLRPQQIGTDLSHDGLNPAHVPLSLANSETVGSFSTARMRCTFFHGFPWRRLYHHPT